MARLPNVFRRKRVKSLAKIIFVSCLLYLLFHSYFGSNDTQEPFITEWSDRPFHVKGVKKLLLWTTFLSRDIFENLERCLKTCKAKCELTTNKDEIHDADAVNFHLSDLWPEIWKIGTQKTIPFPTYRRQDQVWVLWNLEPPRHLWGDLRVFNNLFNWTAWYRLDATVEWVYGRAHRLDNTESENTLKDKRKTRNFYREKSLEIAGRISNCLDTAQRYRIVRDMQKYLHVDMFGHCYGKTCGNSWDHSDKTCLELMKKYKFYLAFENSHCRDYVTEKYWGALLRNQIPIVNWKGINKSVPIPNSYINVYDFKDIESFSAYIKEVSLNETLYNSYFDWKNSYENYAQCPACTLCQELHDNTRRSQVYSNLDGWVRDDMCEKIETLNNKIQIRAAQLFWNKSN